MHSRSEFFKDEFETLELITKKGLKSEWHFKGQVEFLNGPTFVKRVVSGCVSQGGWQNFPFSGFLLRSLIFILKALQKTFIFIVLCFAKYKTIRLSKFETKLKQIRIFILTQFFAKLNRFFKNNCFTSSLKSGRIKHNCYQSLYSKLFQFKVKNLLHFHFKAL